MTNHVRSFKSAKSRAHLATIMDTLNACGGASSAELATVTGLSQHTVRDYLRYMEGVGAAICETPAVVGRGGAQPAWWLPGTGAITHDDAADDLQRRVIVTTSWEPNHRRMALDFYLFGNRGIAEGVLNA